MEVLKTHSSFCFSGQSIYVSFYLSISRMPLQKKKRDMKYADLGSVPNERRGWIRWWRQRWRRERWLSQAWRRLQPGWHRWNWRLVVHLPKSKQQQKVCVGKGTPPTQLEKFSVCAQTHVTGTVDSCRGNVSLSANSNKP